MRELIENISIIAGAHFQKNNDYSIIRYRVLSSILESAYRYLVESKEITAIEELKEVDKKKFWDLAGLYHTEKELRIKASKAAYVLEVVSINN